MLVSCWYCSPCLIVAHVVMFVTGIRLVRVVIVGIVGIGMFVSTWVSLMWLLLLF